MGGTKTILMIFFCFVAGLQGQVVPTQSGFRRPASEEELEYWIENMVRYHQFTAEEVIAATGSPEENPESNRTIAAFLNGNLERNTITASQGSGLIHDVPTCRGLIDRMIAEAKPVLERLSPSYSS